MSFFKRSTENKKRSIFAAILFMFFTFTSLNAVSSYCDGFNDINGNCNSSGVFVPNYGLTHSLATDRDDSKIVIFDKILEFYPNNEAAIQFNDAAGILFNANNSSVTLFRRVPESLGGVNVMEYKSYDKIELPINNYRNGPEIIRNEAVKVRIAFNQYFLWLSAVTTDPEGVQLKVQSATFFTGIPKGAFITWLHKARSEPNVWIADYTAFKNEIARDCANTLRQHSCNTTSISKIFSILNHHHIN